MQFRTLLAAIPLLSLAAADIPYPEATLTVTDGSKVSSQFDSAISSYMSSMASKAEFTSLASVMAYATGLTDNEYNAFVDADTNPLVLGAEYFSASATPAWYTDLPSGDLKSYVKEVADAEASIAGKVIGAADRLGARVAVTGAILAAGFVGMILL